MIHSVFIPGLPKPAGSKRGFPIRKGGVMTGRVAIVDACKGSAQWKADVREAVSRTYKEAPMEGPLMLEVHFFLPRPAGHSGKHGVKPSAPLRPITRPDLLKLTRAVEDALTGIMCNDDAQFVRQLLEKRFANKDRPVGVLVTVAPWNGPNVPP